MQDQLLFLPVLPIERLLVLCNQLYKRNSLRQIKCVFNITTKYTRKLRKDLMFANIHISYINCILFYFIFNKQRIQFSSATSYFGFFIIDLFFIFKCMNQSFYASIYNVPIIYLFSHIWFGFSKRSLVKTFPEIDKDFKRAN